MSVASLCRTYVNVYSTIPSKGNYGAVVYNYVLKISNIPARIVYADGQETIKDGKEVTIPMKLIYLPFQYDVQTTDLIRDMQQDDVYDIVNVDTCNGRHMEIDAKMVRQIIDWSQIDRIIDSSSSSISSNSSSSSSEPI